MAYLTLTRVRIHRWMRRVRQYDTDIAFERVISAKERAELTALV